MFLLKKSIKFFLRLRVSFAEGIFCSRCASGASRWSHTCSEPSRSWQIWTWSSRTLWGASLAIAHYAANFFRRHWENWSYRSICHRSIGLSFFSLIRVNEILAHSLPLLEVMIGFRQKSPDILTVTHQPMLRHLEQEPLQPLFPLEDLLWLVVVPIDQGVFWGDWGDNAGGEAALEDLEKPFEIFISPVHIDSGLPSYLLNRLLQSSLYLIQTEATSTSTNKGNDHYISSYPPSLDHLGPLTLTSW